MPFVQRVVTPKYVARSTKPSHSRGAVSLPVQDYELEAITNLTLSNALRQLASLVLISNQIFTELNKELASVSERSLGIKQRIDNLSTRVEEFDPKQVTVRKYTPHFSSTTASFDPSTAKHRCFLTVGIFLSFPFCGSSCLRFMYLYTFSPPPCLRFDAASRRYLLFTRFSFLYYLFLTPNFKKPKSEQQRNATTTLPVEIEFMNFRQLMFVFPVPQWEREMDVSGTCSGNQVTAQPTIINLNSTRERGDTRRRNPPLTFFNYRRGPSFKT